MKDDTYDRIMELDNSDGYGDEFSYYDEYPEDDPFAPKPSCPWCDGTGEKRGPDDRLYECPDCHGTGVER